MLGRLVTEPVPGTTGGRPPLTETGWLTNGQRSPSTSRGEAMARRSPWQPPRESARRRHSIFVDVELWDEHDGQRTWSCPMLAAVWQLLRLGLLRDRGRPVVTPRDWTDPVPGQLGRDPAGHPAQPRGGRVRRLHDAFGLVTALPAGRTGRADHSQPVRLRRRHPRGGDRPGRAGRDATASRTGRPDPLRVRGAGRHRPRVNPLRLTRRSGARGWRRSHKCSNWSSRSRTRAGIGASRVRRMPGRVWPEAERRRRRRLVTDGPVEDDEVEDHATAASPG